MIRDKGKRLTIEEKVQILVSVGNIGKIKQKVKDANDREKWLGEIKHSIKVAYGKGKLTKEQIELLETNGMVWEEHKQPGRKSLDVLIASGRNLGEIRQNGRNLSPEERKLASAKHTLIVLYRKGLLSKEIIREAEEHGMVWGRKPLGRKELDLLIASGRNLAKIQQKGKKLTDEEKILGEAKHTLINYYREGRLSEEIISEAEQYGMTWGRRIKRKKKKEKTDDDKDTLESLRAEKQELEAREKRAKELLEEVEIAIEEKGEER